VFLADGRLVESARFPLAAVEPPHGRPAPAGRDPAGEGLHLVRRRYWASLFPRRTILAEAGSHIRLRVHNRLGQPHRFTIDGVVDTGPIPPGQTATAAFPAPAPGTYVYHDPGNPPVERVLGLHGVLVVAPADPWRLTAGGPEFERQWLWICHDIDPEWGRLARMGVRVDPDRVPCLPRYFTLNDRSGIFSIGVSTDEAVNEATHRDTLPAGSARRTDVRDFSLAGTRSTVVTGQLLRLVNTGVAIHQMHFHGNHVWTLARDGLALSRRAAVVDAEGDVQLQQWEDVVPLGPMRRLEVMLPLKPPPDALEEVRAAQDCDWHYPMHCHAEMSQTAGGGLYPGGLVADWILAAPLRP
jgi:FtsP/CotA-like multicopper oxidase with cupredoxin domain